MALPLPLDDGIALGMQQTHALNVAAIQQQGIRSNAVDTFTKDQTVLGHLRGVNLNDAIAARTLSGGNDPINNAILTARAARDQPNVSPTVAFVPSPVTATNPK